MPSCLSGYGVDLRIINSPSPTASSSPSSTLSESCTRKPRTPRKRPNQTYNEAAALLSSACPTIFSTNQFAKTPRKFTKRIHESFFHQSSELIDDQPCFPIDPKPCRCLSPAEIDSRVSRAAGGFSSEVGEIYEGDFESESMLDVEIEEGIIDSIMGISAGAAEDGGGLIGNTTEMCFGGKLDSGVRPLRQADDGNWWWSPTVEIRTSAAKKKKKKYKAIDFPIAEFGESMQLKLNYDEVIRAWSGRSRPSSETDVYVRRSPDRRKSKYNEMRSQFCLS